MDAKVDQDSQNLREQLAASARDMIPVLRERAPAAEKNRRVVAETQQAFIDSGFYRIFQPRRYGGYELGFEAMLPPPCFPET